MTGQSWIVVRIKPNQGRRAQTNAEQQGYEWYVPRGMFRSPKTRKLREEPLFPGYAFARHPAGRWASLSGTLGVLDIIKVSEDAPATLPHRDIERWRSREGADGLVRLEAREFEMGEKVRVDRGVVTLDAIIDGMAGRDRVFVLLGVLGGARAEVDVKDVSRE